MYLKKRLWYYAVSLRDGGLLLTSILPTSSLRISFYKHIFGMNIGKDVFFGRNCLIYGPRRISIGTGTWINNGVVLDGRLPLQIGDHVSISIFSIILTLEHDLNDEDFASQGGKVVIEDRVFIGARGTILPGITIGVGAAVAAGSVVTKDVEPYTVVAGIPARPIAKRPISLNYRLGRKPVRWGGNRDR